MSAPSASRQLLLSTLLLSLTPPVTANGGYDDLLYFLLGLLVVCAVLVGLGGYAAVGLLRFVCMQPPVTLRQAMQGRQGGACACCPCHSFDSCSAKCLCAKKKEGLGFTELYITIH